MRKALNKVPFSILIVLVLTLGLMPYFPAPHIWQKISMLLAGELSGVVNFFDLIFHSLPWILLALKIATLRAEDNFEDS